MKFKCKCGHDEFYFGTYDMEVKSGKEFSSLEELSEGLRFVATCMKCRESWEWDGMFDLEYEMKNAEVLVEDES